MKKLFVLALVACAGVSYGDTTLHNFDAATSGSTLSNWLPGFSGTSDGMDSSDDEALVTVDQKQSGIHSLKLLWDWTGDGADGATSGVVRIQPAAQISNNATASHAAEPYIGLAVYGAAQGDDFSIYMGEGAAGNGASPYERFTKRTKVTWNGWRVVESNVNDPVVAWVNGDGTLAASNSFSGIFVYQGTGANGRVTYYVDDLAFTTASRAPSGVDNWSVY